MIKALFVSIGIVVLFVGVYVFNIYDFLASRVFFWSAVGIFIVALAAAGVVLGNPYAKEDKDDADED